MSRLPQSVPVSPILQYFMVNFFFLISSISYEEAHNWGLRMDNGSWIGAVGMLTTNDADLVAAEVMMATDRLDDIEYTTPVYSTKSVLLIS